MKKYTLSITAAIIIVGCCKKKDDPCEQVQNNPIKVKVEVPYGSTYQDLNIYPNETFYYETDTMMSVVYPKFTVTGEFDSVKWIVGNNLNVYKQRSFIISFQDSVGTVPITCITYHQSNKDCYGGRISDTIVKNIFVTDERNAKVIGQYTGYSTEHPDEIFEFSLFLNEFQGFYFKNFPNHVDSCRATPMTVTYDRFQFNNTAFFYYTPIQIDSSIQLWGMGRIYDNDSLIINVDKYKKFYRPPYDHLPPKEGSFIIHAKKIN